MQLMLVSTARGINNLSEGAVMKPNVMYLQTAPAFIVYNGAPVQGLNQKKYHVQVDQAPKAATVTSGWLVCNPCKWSRVRYKAFQCFCR